MIDSGLLLSQLLPMLWWVFALLTLASLLKSPWFKGFIGETMINLSIRFLLDKNDYHLIKNVTIPTEDGTTQIDHIIASRFGVFVIETKNMKGWIFGTEKQKMWTQQIYKSKHKFQNPLHQNYKHTKTLESALAIEPDKLFSVVVFVGDSTFKTDVPANVTTWVNFIRYIKSKTAVLLTEPEVQKIIRQIANGRLKPSIKTHINHANHVREIIAKKSKPETVSPIQSAMETAPNPVAPSTNHEPPQSAANKMCPKCGSTMLLRTAKKGPQAGNQFWGCSEFPKCRKIASI